MLDGGIVPPYLPGTDTPPHPENPQSGETEALELVRRRWEIAHG